MLIALNMSNTISQLSLPFTVYFGLFKFLLIKLKREKTSDAETMIETSLWSQSRLVHGSNMGTIHSEVCHVTFSDNGAILPAVFTSSFSQLLGPRIIPYKQWGYNCVFDRSYVSGATASFISVWF